jgi:hypothetical protein
MPRSVAFMNCVVMINSKMGVRPTQLSIKFNPLDRSFTPFS